MKFPKIGANSMSKNSTLSKENKTSEAKTVTPEEVLDTVRKNFIPGITRKSCALCSVPLDYTFRASDDRVKIVPYFSEMCACSLEFIPEKETTWQEVADWINSQSGDSRTSVLAKFMLA